MAALHCDTLTTVPLARVAGRTRSVPLDDGLVQTARAIGIAFGD